MMITESYFPELENMTPKRSNKWGILNVCLTACDRVVTGYQWKYSYFDGIRMRVLSSYDLEKLKRRVLNKGLSWVITDEDYAQDSFVLNRQLLRKHEEYKITRTRENTASGVKYVYKTVDKHSKKGFYWIFLNTHREGQKSYTGKTLERLRARVEREGFTWEVINQEIYESIVASEVNET